MPVLIRLQNLCNIGHKGIIRIRIGQKRTDAQQNLADSQCRTPLVLEDIKTDSSIGIDVAVVDTGSKVYLGGLEGIICWELNFEEEDSAGVGGIIGSHDCCLPVEHIISNGSSGAVGRRVFSEVDEF
jgi:hypothetical protein